MGGRPGPAGQARAGGRRRPRSWQDVRVTPRHTVHPRHTVALIVAVALACAGLGLWLGTSVASDAGSVAVIVAACAILGTFAPGTIRWAAGARRRFRSR